MVFGPSSDQILTVVALIIFVTVIFALKRTDKQCHPDLRASRLDNIHICHFGRDDKAHILQFSLESLLERKEAC